MDGLSWLLFSLDLTENDNQQIPETTSDSCLPRRDGAYIEFVIDRNEKEYFMKTEHIVCPGTIYDRR